MDKRFNKLSLFLAFKQRAVNHIESWFHRYKGQVISKVCIEGMGDWGKKAYRPALANLPASGLKVKALYRDLKQTLLPSERFSWEQFEAKNSAVTPIQAHYDLLVVATPDTAHIEVLEPSIGMFSSAIVEKPFCIDSHDLLRAKKIISNGGNIWGIDHYPYYISKAISSSQKIIDHLGGSIKRLEFVLLQKKPIEQERIKSLSQGLGYDMLAHWFALLVALGLNGEIKKPVIRYAGQHSKAKVQNQENTGQTHFDYQAETCVDFEFQLSFPTENIECKAIAGKGLPVDLKYMDLFGANNNAVRFDLGSKEICHPHYPYGCISYISPKESHVKDPDNYLGILTDDWNIERGELLTTQRVYDRLFLEFACGNLSFEAASCLFTYEECEWIVHALEVMKEQLLAYCRAKGKWLEYEMGTFPKEWRASYMGKMS